MCQGRKLRARHSKHKKVVISEMSIVPIDHAGHITKVVANNRLKIKRKKVVMPKI